MNYELAKQLKDAGFPIQYSGAKHALEKPFDDEWHSTIEYGYIIPTLSELIEACGTKNTKFNYLFKGNGEYSLWVAGGLIRQKANEFEHEFKYEGSNPEEAVAKLWLALNKK